MARIGMNLTGHEPAEFAKHVEQTGLDSIWVGDHLANDMPMLDSTVSVGAAAAVTQRIELGLFTQVALRRTAWVARHVGSLQTLSRNRILLGVGIGGDWPDEWAAAGMPLDGRGERTDETLKALPDLLAGHATRTPDTGVTIRLLPAAAMPQVWIGGGSKRARRRVAELGNGWLPAMLTPGELTKGLAEIKELASQLDRPEPQGGVQLFGSLGTSTDALAQNLNKRYSLPDDKAAQILVGGAPAQIAARLHEFVEAGAEHLTVVTFGPDWRIQAELLATAKDLLQG
jgi:alkanesulfonate monooxygenase SsuD/methylene tetrahydromethanopterin reductase-like flavin-dependent oxidoreductase (luciferase family)